MSSEEKIQQLEKENWTLRQNLETQEAVLDAHRTWAMRVHEKLQTIYANDPAYQHENGVAFLGSI